MELDLWMNLSNCTEKHSNISMCPADCHSTLYQKIMGTIVFIVIWPFIVMDCKKFPIGRPGSALLGAVLMVIFHVINQPEAYRTEGLEDHLQTLFLLIGMMVLSYYIDREGLFAKIAVMIFGNSMNFNKILWRVCLLTAVLSAFITNDAACLVVTPLVLNMYASLHSRNSKDELYLLSLGIATSSNIGSASTIFGNPQNILIGASTQIKISLLDFLIAVLPASVIAMVINITLLMIFQKIIKKCRRCYRQNINQRDDYQSIVDPETTRAILSVAESREASRQRLTNDNSNEDSSESTRLVFERQPVQSDNDECTYQSSLPVASTTHSRSVLVSSVQNCDVSEASTVHSARDLTPLKTPLWRKKLFIVWLIFISLLVVVLLSISVPQMEKRGVYFKLGLTPVAAAVFTMVVDSILNGKYPQRPMTKVDWPVILMFMGIFVWIDGFKHTCIPTMVFEQFKPYMNLEDPVGVIVFTIFVLIGSNIFSNVPLVLILIDHLDKFCGTGKCEITFKTGGLLLAWVSTIAGNLTLFGSIANLIVAEKVKDSQARHDLTCLRHFRYGFISTILITCITVPIVWGMGYVTSKYLSI